MDTTRPLTGMREARLQGSNSSTARALAALKAQLDELGNNITELGDALAPILATEQIEKLTGTPKPPVEGRPTELSDAIYLAVDRAEGFSQRITEIRRRVEL